MGDLTYTDNHGVNAGVRSPICHTGWVCLSTSHEIHERNQIAMRSAGGTRRTTGRQVSLQRDIRKRQIADKEASEELKDRNRGQLGKLEDRWETYRLEGGPTWKNDPCWSMRSGER